MSRTAHLLLLGLCLTLLSGSDSCPLSISTTPNTTTPVADGGTSSGGDGIDLGGSSGAYWTLTYAGQLTLTQRTASGVATAQAPVTAASFALDGSVFFLPGFCTGSGTLCPHAVMPSPVQMIQPVSPAGQVVVGFNRTGPLERIKTQVGLFGTLQGSQLDVPLGTAGIDPNNYCALQNGSRIEAQAGDLAADGRTARSLQGTVTLRFRAECFNLTAGNAVTPGALVDLSVSFTGVRK